MHLSDHTNAVSDPQSFPKYIPSTLPEEASQLPGTEVARRARAPTPDDAVQGTSQASQTPAAGPSRRLTRRATSQTPTPESAPAVAAEDDSQIPKRVRQTCLANILTSI